MPISGGERVGSCIGRNRSDNGIAPPLEAYTQLDPETELTATFSFGGASEPGTFVSFSSVLAFRIVSDTLRDPTLPEAERRASIRTMSISFPAYPLTRSTR